MTADIRPVAVSRTSGDEAVIEKGLAPGEKVVTDGQIRLMPGAKVEIKEGQGGGGNGRKTDGKEQGAEGEGDGKQQVKPEDAMKEKAK
jgi:multidrug efflux system membrane fusion protein